MLNINTNINALFIQNSGLKSHSNLQKAIERLSSGLRINGAKDDAAGQAISNRMASQISGIQQARRNASDGLSMAKTAEGALNEVNQLLQRIRELSVQSLSETYSLEDADSVQAEINLNLKEIARLNSQSTFNGINILDGSAGNVSLQIGANDNDTLGLYLGKPGFSVDELGLTDLVIRGINGSVVTTDQLQGYASNIPVEKINFSASLNSPKLVRDNSGNIYIQSTDSQNNNIYYPTSIPVATYYTASDSATVGYSASPLYTDVTSLPSRSAPASAISFNGVPNDTGASTLVSSNGKYYIYQDQGIDQYYEAEVSWGLTGAIQANVINTVPVDTLGSPVTMNSLPEITATSANISYQDSEGNAFPGTNRLVKNGSQYYIEVNNGSGDYQYYKATASINSDGSNTRISVNATDNNPMPLFTDVTTVSGTSIVTLDPSKMQIRYTDSDGYTFDDVLKLDSDGNYIMNIGGDSKTATFVYQDNGTLLIKTLNNTGDVQIYYPPSYSASTDAGNPPWTTITLRENGEGIRLRHPENPLAAIDAAIARVDERRSQLGATMNRLDSIINVQSSTSVALSAARSRIEDADYAVEVSNMSRAQILQQAGTAMLAQSNHVPETVLTLLRN